MKKTVSVSVPTILKNKLISFGAEQEISKLLKEYYIKAMVANKGLNWKFQIFRGDSIVKIAMNENEFQFIKNIENIPDNISNTLNARVLAVLYGYLFPNNIEKPAVNSLKENQQRISKKDSAESEVINHTLMEYVKSSGKVNNPDQERLSKNLMRTLNSQNDIQMAEAATGVGKGAVIVTAAIEQTLKGNGPVIVSAPTFKILNQLVNEHLTVEKAINKCIPHVLIFGKNEFISSYALLEWLNDEHHALQGYKDLNSSEVETLELIQKMEKLIKDVQDWIDGGAEDDPHALYKKPWALSGLLYHVDNVDTVVHCVLTNAQNIDDEDEGLKSYRKQFTDALATDIVYCSHAMLARDTLRKVMSKYRTLKKDAQLKSWFDKSINEFLNAKDESKEKTSYLSYLSSLINSVESEDIANSLPDTKKLIIDEAHLFEENFSNAVSMGVPLNKLINSVKKINESAFHQLRFLQDKVIDLAGTENIIWMDNRSKSREIISIVAEMKQIMTKKVLPKLNKKKRKTVNDQFIYDGNTALSGILNMSETLLSLISFSSIRKYPSIYSSKKNIDKELNFLWEDKSVCLVSATLYIPTPGNAQDEKVYMNILSIPRQRHVGMIPIRPKWVTEPVTFLMPDKNNELLIKTREVDLITSSNEDGLLSDNDVIEDVVWIKDIAKYLHDARDTTVGGTLVLMTSYDTVNQLEHELSRLAPDIPLIVSRRGVKIESNTHNFIESAKQGLKPIWLATGQSWTGTDISGRNIKGQTYDPAVDNILTDLVIPKLPFRVNRSVSHIQRSKISFIAEINMTITILIQGIGRLVRSMDLPHNRRIHFLDKRIYTNNHYNTIAMQFDSVRNRYKKHKTVTFDLVQDKWKFD